MRKKLESLITQYGPVALGTYLFIFVLVLVGFVLAIRAGLQPSSTAAQAGVLGAAYLATKATQPLRILATFVLTPLVARLLSRRPSA
ncbi:MAG: hypothetical protein AAB426_10945 [Myxococcota bacterium]